MSVPWMARTCFQELKHMFRPIYPIMSYYPSDRQISSYGLFSDWNTFLQYLGLGPQRILQRTLPANQSSTSMDIYGATRYLRS